MKRSEMIKAIQEVLAEKKRPGLWANINAKKKAGRNHLTVTLMLIKML